MTRRIILASIAAALCATQVKAQDERAEWWAEAPKPATTKKVTAPVPVVADDTTPPSTGIREVSVKRREPIVVNTRLRIATMIELPATERILDQTSGDPELWTVKLVGDNMVHVKPSEAGKVTNMTLVTATGGSYIFLLRENAKGIPDLKVTVLADPDVAPAAPKWVPIAQLEAVQAELLAVRAALETERQRAEEKISVARRQSATDLKCGEYGGFEPNTKPFFVESICRTEEFTYVKLGPKAREKPILYEEKDGSPSAIEYRLESNTYIVPRVLERAYLARGKERMNFELKGN